MTLLGKIFVVIIFCLSLVCAVGTVAVYQTQTNWRTLVVNEDAKNGPLGLRKQVEDAKKQNTELLAQIDKLKHQMAIERGARVEALAALETRLAEARKELAQKQTTYETLVVSERDAVATLQTEQNNLARLKEEVDKLRTKIVELQQDRDTQFAEVLRLTDQWHQYQGLEKRLNERNKQLLAQVAHLEKTLEDHGIEADAPPLNNPPKINGLVTAVGTGDLVEISIGSDDGLREGHVLDVTRGSTYLGRVKVTRVAPDRAVAEIDPQFKQGSIQKGDTVATKTQD